MAKKTTDRRQISAWLFTSVAMGRPTVGNATGSLSEHRLVIDLRLWVKPGTTENNTTQWAVQRPGHSASADLTTPSGLHRHHTINFLLLTCTQDTFNSSENHHHHLLMRGL